jgi:hypothetical protein
MYAFRKGRGPGKACALYVYKSQRLLEENEINARESKCKEIVRTMRLNKIDEKNAG